MCTNRIAVAMCPGSPGCFPEGASATSRGSPSPTAALATSRLAAQLARVAPRDHSMLCNRARLFVRFLQLRCGGATLGNNVGEGATVRLPGVRWSGARETPGVVLDVCARRRFAVRRSLQIRAALLRVQRLKVAILAVGVHPRTATAGATASASDSHLQRQQHGFTEGSNSHSTLGSWTTALVSNTGVTTGRSSSASVPSRQRGEGGVCFLYPAPADSCFR